MLKLPLKSVIISILLTGVMLFFYGCAYPVNIDTFLEDERVQDIVEKSKEKVVIHPDSESGLIADYEKITGLDPNKYYMIEEMDDNGNSLYVDFISDDGKKYANLSSIGLVSGGEITGLINFKQYRVTSASPVNGTFAYADLTSAPVSAAGFMPITASNGNLAIYEPKNSNYLDLGSVFDDPDDYSIVRVGAGAYKTASSPEAGMFVIRLDNTSGDYIFFNDNAVSGTTRFWVLRVIIEEIPTINISVNYNENDPLRTLTFSSGATISLNTLQTGNVQLVINNFNNLGATSVRWYLPNNLEITGHPATLNNSHIGNFPPGVYNITIQMVINGQTYSGALVLTVTYTP